MIMIGCSDSETQQPSIMEKKYAKKINKSEMEKSRGKKYLAMKIVKIHMGAISAKNKTN